MKLFSTIRMTIKVFLSALLQRENHLYEITIKRNCFLIVALPLFLSWQVFNWLCFQLDEVFYKNYKKIALNKPIFIIGPTRSATTFLFRLLALDQQQFTVIPLWEILFAPAIVQKKFWLLVQKIDNFLGSPLGRILAKIDVALFKKINKIHPTSLFLPEEDALLLIHIFSSMYLFVLFPLDKNLVKYGKFDEQLSEKEKHKVMEFYKKCLQKHLYVFGPDQQMLSKSPVWSAAPESLLHYFPDARLIYLRRNPLQVVPSSLSFFYFLSSHFFTIKSKKEVYERSQSFLLFWIQHTLMKKNNIPTNQLVIIRFEELTECPYQCIFDLYKKLDIFFDVHFEKTLKSKILSTPQHNSQHQYSLEEFGLDRAIMEKKYAVTTVF